MTSTPFLLSGGAFTQDWSNIGLITASDDWSGVPSIQGFRGDNLTAATDVDPRTVLGDETTLDVNANQTNPNTFGTGGVAEFEITNPVVALQGSGTADAPFLVFYLNTSGRQNIRVQYNVRDIDGSTDNAVQQVALQYRVGNSGNFIDVPAGYIADATTGGTATQVTAIDVTLPAEANNRAEVQVRVITTNANGNDEWVGIDDINITSTAQAGSGVNIAQSGGSTDVTEGGATDTYTIALNSAPTSDVTINFNTGSQVTVSPASLTFTSANFATPQTVTVTAVDDALAEGLHTGTITHTATSADAAYNNITIGSVTANITDNDFAVLKIHEVQGTGNASTLVGQTVTIEGIVVADYQGTGQIGGFFVQEEDADVDGNALTSEGISVFSTTAVNVGDKVRITGPVAEFGSGGNTLTQLGSSSTVTVVSSNNPLPTAAIVDLPVTNLTDLERFEGMRVTFPETLTVSETFTLARFGEILLSSDGRRFQPTEFVDPNDNPATGTSFTGTGNVSAVTSQQTANNLRAITLDDGLSTQNPAAIPFLNNQNTRRIGDTVTGLTGVLDQRFPGTTNPNGYRIQPTGTVTFADTNPRPLDPPSVGGNLKVGSFNLLNYFTTIDNGTNVTGPNNNLEPRGAENNTEFSRQRQKTATTIFELNADVLGLIELENNGTTAISDLVNAVNAKAGAGTYAFIQDPVGYTTFAGGDDAIKVAFIYKPSVVTPVGNALAPNDSSFFQLGRAPVAQTFLQNSNGATFTPVINHFKSKGADGATGLNLDQNDGQGAFNSQRRLQAQALVNFVNNTVIPTSGDSDVLILGDLNAYGEEDPIDLIRNAGFSDQIDRFDGNATSYSFVFQGQSGRLDHALSTPSLNNQVTGAAE
ncbi:MAG: ExeM/NucH family extracellular endonuclease, partial [Pseudanabaenaceae cyanobacterium bins.68]|nr:ExeM/NucH family extracellular endonuclease [Pseudanabaenaceae cyanobacterium bins.68]